MRLLTILSLALAAVSLPVLAKDPEMPTILKTMTGKGAQAFYIGEYQNMDGWALVKNGKPDIFYVNKDRTAVIMGLMFNGDGDMITMAQLGDLHDKVGDDMYAATGGLSSLAPTTQTPSTTDTTQTATTQKREPLRPLSKAELMYADLLGANWVTMNSDSPNDVFAFIDPNCPHCKTMLQDVSHMSGPDGIRLRIIPVGILSDDSLRRAAMVLASANPVERLAQYAMGDETALEAPENITLDAAEKNTRTMLKHGFDVTPMVVYRTKKGEIRLVRGRPNDYTMIVNDIKNN